MTRLVLSAAVVASASLLSADSAAAFNPGTSDRRAALADVAKLLGGAVAAGTVLPQQASAGLANPVRCVRNDSDILICVLNKGIYMRKYLYLSRSQHLFILEIEHNNAICSAFQ